jgi:hypothetical protein
MLTSISLRALVLELLCSEVGDAVGSFFLVEMCVRHIFKGRDLLTAERTPAIRVEVDFEVLDKGLMRAIEIHHCCYCYILVITVNG